MSAKPTPPAQEITNQEITAAIFGNVMRAEDEKFVKLMQPEPEDHSEKIANEEPAFFQRLHAEEEERELIPGSILDSVALSDDRPFPILYCTDCKEQITAAQRRQYWADMVDMNADNGWELHHIKCQPVPLDRMMGDMPHHVEAEQPKLIKPSGKNGGKR